jgi:[ribosomal protein S5]-alanine N-acetyltransferase
MLNVEFTPFPVLETDRLLLRQTTQNDAKELFQLRSDERVMKYIDRPRPKSIDDIIQLIQKMHNMVEANQGIEWGMILKESNTYIGTVSYHRLIKEHFRAEIGYLLHPDHQRKALMNEAIKAILHYGFNTMGLHSVEANIYPLNVESQKVLERNNFIREAYFRENYFWNGKFLDTAVYTLLAPAQ